MFSSQPWNRKYTDPLAGQLGLPVDVLLEESIWLLHKSKSFYEVLPAQCQLVAGSKATNLGAPLLELYMSLANHVLLRIALNPFGFEKS